MGVRTIEIEYPGQGVEMRKKTMTVHTRGVDVETWKAFRVLCFYEGVSAAEKVRQLIYAWVESVTKTRPHSD